VSDDLRDFSFAQHVARVLFALGATAVVGIISIFAMRWVFGV
jgi:hypothetical protein